MAASASPNSYVSCYWWKDEPNFGDRLTPQILAAAGIKVVHANKKQARTIGIGSLLQMFPLTFDGTIWTTGLIRNQAHPMHRARILAVRGKLTRDLVVPPDLRPTVVLGDGGLLVSKFFPLNAGKSNQKRRRYRIGIVPHYVDYKWVMTHCNLAQRDSSDVLIIDMLHARPPKETAHLIAQCDLIISSSLHGLIVADAYGVPNLHFQVPTSTAITGDGFKYRDYRSAFDLPMYETFVLTTSTTANEIASAVGASPQPTVAQILSIQEDLTATLPLLL